MLPSIKDNQILLLKKFDIDKISNGDIISFKIDIYPDEYLIKRVIAKGGDKIEIDGKNVILNDNILSEPYINSYEEEYHTGEIIVPNGYYFVMGDNRDFSSDSRDFGLVYEEDIVGILLFP